MTTRFVRLESGLRLRVIETGPPHAYPVLLVHGWGGCVYSFAELLPALAHAGFRAIALDLPGHGLSDKPTDDEQYSTRALLDAVLGVAADAGLRRYAYIGHSMGGLLGLRLAAGGLQGLDRLVLINAAGLTRIAVLGPVRLLSPRVIDGFVPALLSRAVINGILRVAFGTAQRPTERDIDEYWALTQWDAYATACRACLHRVDFRRLPATKLRSLRLPVLVITGGRDRVVGDGTKRGKLIPTARLVSVPDGGHLVMQECASRTNGEILNFLSGART